MLIILNGKYRHDVFSLAVDWVNQRLCLRHVVQGQRLNMAVAKENINKIGVARFDIIQMRFTVHSRNGWVIRPGSPEEALRAAGVDSSLRAVVVVGYPDGITGHNYLRSGYVIAVSRDDPRGRANC